MPAQICRGQAGELVLELAAPLCLEGIERERMDTQDLRSGIEARWLSRRTYHGSAFCLRATGSASGGGLLFKPRYSHVHSHADPRTLSASKPGSILQASCWGARAPACQLGAIPSEVASGQPLGMLQIPKPAMVVRAARSMLQQSQFRCKLQDGPDSCKKHSWSSPFSLFGCLRISSFCQVSIFELFDAIPFWR